MNIDPAQDAISAALKGEWDKAIQINESILLNNPQDVDALNRLARAHFGTGNLKSAKECSAKAIKIDPFNSIAQKSLQKWKSMSSSNGKNRHSLNLKVKDARTFLEESGKTKITSLLHLGESKTIASLGAGDELELNAHQHRVYVATTTGKYVGKLTDDLSARLRRLVKFGNKYEVLVKSVDPNGVKVFIRETERNPKVADTPSFPTEKIDYISFTPPELIHQKEKLTDSESD